MTIEKFEKSRALVIDIEKLKEKIENIMQYKRWMNEQNYTHYAFTLSGHHIDNIPKELAESVIDERLKTLKDKVSELEEEFESL